MHRYLKGVKNLEPGCFQYRPVAGQEAMAQTQVAPYKISGISYEINIGDFNLFIIISVRFQTCEGRDINDV